jgi:TolA-binding protein
MRYLIMFVVFAALLASEVALASASAPAIAQTQNSAQEKAASLRAQLSGVETKQGELQTRLQKLEEDLKPENIEHNLAGIGSTRPEDLREQRHRQLEIERNGVRAQLDLLATSHTRLETAIAQADADAYRQSAAPVSVPATNHCRVDRRGTNSRTSPPGQEKESQEIETSASPAKASVIFIVGFCTHEILVMIYLPAADRGFAK